MVSSPPSPSPVTPTIDRKRSRSAYTPESADDLPPIPDVVERLTVGGVVLPTAQVDGRPFVNLYARSSDAWLTKVCGDPSAGRNSSVVTELRTKVESLRGKHSRACWAVNTRGEPLGDTATVEMDGFTLTVCTRTTPLRFLCTRTNVEWFIDRVRHDVVANKPDTTPSSHDQQEDIDVDGNAIDVDVVIASLLPDVMHHLVGFGIRYYKSRRCFHVSHCSVHTDTKLPQQFRVKIATNQNITDDLIRAAVEKQAGCALEFASSGVAVGTADDGVATD